jgi:hypothetical protein
MYDIVSVTLLAHCPWFWYVTYGRQSGSDMHDWPLLWVSLQKRLRRDVTISTSFNLLKPTGYVMHQHFNIQQLYVLPTLYLCVLYLSLNKQRLVPLTA